METIFDHNPTDEELIRFGGRKLLNESVKEFGEKFLSNSDDSYYMIGLLYCMRKDYEKAKTYFNRIENRSMLSTLAQDF